MSSTLVARRKAQQLLTQYGSLRLCEMDIEDFAAVFDVNVERKALVGTTATLLRSNERAVISVDQALAPSQGRYRFTIAHELGHFFLHRELQSAFSCTDEMFLPWYQANGAEFEANSFGAELLMPEDDFRTRTKGQNATAALVRHEAEYFGTSWTSICVRFVELAAYRLIMYVVADGRVKWFRASSAVSLNEILPIGTTVSDDTSAGSYFLTQDDDESTGILPSDLWLRDTTNWHEQVCESPLYLKSMNTVISLIWEP
ncbi:MAG TPA: ImmA/IrrE family metallo-endopeptidase [bacterium]|jgi:Zn-dependent peptidase ImmA (M78 family)